MDQKEFKTELVNLYGDYKKAVAAANEQIDKDNEKAKNPTLDIAVTFDGFMSWLESGQAA